MACPSPSTSIDAAEVASVTGLFHTAVRPSWVCPSCDVPWPCATARRDLRAEYADAPVSLGLYLAACMVEAAEQLPAESTGELYARFLGWIRSRH